jgi:hypothetical protein
MKKHNLAIFVEFLLEKVKKGIICLVKELQSPFK